jgi:2-keto-4-pentenoate hydratase
MIMETLKQPQTYVKPIAAAGSIVFSGSATKGVHLAAGNTYTVEIKGLGKVEIKAS